MSSSSCLGQRQKKDNDVTVEVEKGSGLIIDVIETKLKFVRLSDNAKTPTRGSFLAAGYDLYAAEDAIIAPGERAVVRTDLKFQIPKGTYGRLASRSGLAVTHGIHVGAGVIDAGKVL